MEGEKQLKKIFLKRGKKLKKKNKNKGEKILQIGSHMKLLP